MSTTRINNQIRAKELRVVTDEGDNLGVISVKEALQKAQDMGLDLIEISPNANPPVAKIMDYGKYQYDMKKKAKEAKAKAHKTETKSVQIKVTTGEHDLALKAKKASEWLAEGHRIKFELYLRGREKGTNKEFQEERLQRILRLISENYKIADPFKKGPKGLMITIERDTSKKSTDQPEAGQSGNSKPEIPVEKAD